MTQYAITFPARTMVLTDEEFQQAGIDANAVVEEMKAAGFVADAIKRAKQEATVAPPER